MISRVNLYMPPTCQFGLFDLFYDLDTRSSNYRTALFGPWGDNITSASRDWPKISGKRSKKTSRKGKKPHTSRKHRSKDRMVVFLDPKACSSFPSSYMTEYVRHKEEKAGKGKVADWCEMKHAQLQDKKSSLSLTDVKLCDYQDLSKMKQNLPSLSHTVLKYDAADQTYCDQYCTNSLETFHVCGRNPSTSVGNSLCLYAIPNSLQPRSQLKQPRKCRKLSVPYSDHLAHHITELKAHSICTIIEPRDPKTFKFPASDVASTDTQPHRLDLSMRDQCHHHDTIKSYSSIDQPKDKLSDYLLHTYEKNYKNSKCSFILSKREKSLTSNGSREKSIASTCSSNSSKKQSDSSVSSRSTGTVRSTAGPGVSYQPNREHYNTANQATKGYKYDFGSRHSTFMWQAPLSYDIGPNNTLHLPDIQAVVKITEKAMNDAFLTPITDDPPARDKTRCYNSSGTPSYSYQRLIDLCKGKSYQNFNLAKELSKLSSKSSKPSDIPLKVMKTNSGNGNSGNSGNSGNTNVTKSGDCIYCKLVMRRLDLYQAHQFGVTSERMLIYKRMQKQTN